MGWGSANRNLPPPPKTRGPFDTAHILPPLTVRRLRSRRLLPLILLSVCLLLFTRAHARAQSAQASPAPLAVQTAPAPLARTELFFGAVPLDQWNHFLAEVVTPRFPDGLTWFDSHGQWQDRSGAITKEDSRVLILIHAPTSEKDRLINEVRAEFKTRYNQQSVLRADQAVTASF